MSLTINQAKPFDFAAAVWYHGAGNTTRSMEGRCFMNDKEQVTVAIDAYANLLRIQQAEDKDREIANQMSVLKAKLQACGVVVDEITIR